MTAGTLLIAIALGLVHILAGHLSLRAAERRSPWLSAAGGVTVAFIFLYLMPELGEFRQVLVEHHALGAVEELIYVVALLGVVVYYGLEHLAANKRPDPADLDLDEPPFGHDYVFWLHMAWYALYNILIGILLLHGRQETVSGLLAYGLAMAVHIAVIDAAMRNHHRHVYERTGRWILAVTVLVGWALGAFVAVPIPALAAITSFLVGAMLINAVKEELPTGRQTRVGPFFAAAAVSSVILLAI